MRYILVLPWMAEKFQFLGVGHIGRHSPGANFRVGANWPAQEGGPITRGRLTSRPPPPTKRLTDPLEVDRPRSADLQKVPLPSSLSRRAWVRKKCGPVCLRHGRALGRGGYRHGAVRRDVSSSAIIAAARGPSVAGHRVSRNSSMVSSVRQCKAATAGRPLRIIQTLKHPLSPGI